MRQLRVPPGDNQPRDDQAGQRDLLFAFERCLRVPCQQQPLPPQQGPAGALTGSSPTGPALYATTVSERNSIPSTTRQGRSVLARLRIPTNPASAKAFRNPPSVNAPDRHPLQSCASRCKWSGTGLSETMSEITARPP